MTTATWLAGVSCFAVGLGVGWMLRPAPPPSEPTDAKPDARTAVFPDWRRHAVAYRGGLAGGYEMLLRAAGAEGIDYSRFQEEFVLGPNGNNFTSVSAAIQRKYPQVRFTVRDFPTGQEKLHCLEERMSRGEPTMAAITMSPNGFCNCTPVVDADATTLTLFGGVQTDGTIGLWVLKKADLVRRRDEWHGAGELTWVESVR
jgi:hypothetical protein